jgi:hypothetical protein
MRIPAPPALNRMARDLPSSRPGRHLKPGSGPFRPSSMRHEPPLDPLLNKEGTQALNPLLVKEGIKGRLTMREHESSYGRHS